MDTEQRMFIKGYHVNVIHRKDKIARVMVGHKPFYWGIPDKLKTKLKKGELVLVTVKNKHTAQGEERKRPVREGTVLIDDIITDYEPEEGVRLRFVKKKYTGAKSRTVLQHINDGLINKELDEGHLARVLAKNCNLSERSINGLLKKYGEDNVKKAVNMYLAVDDKKAPLKFIKFILENIS